MRYRKPFDQKQRLDVTREYESFRTHVLLLRKTYPPRSSAEKLSLKRYREHVYAFGAELLRVNSAVRPAELNRQAPWAEPRLRNTFTFEFRSLRTLKCKNVRLLPIA